MRTTWPYLVGVVIVGTSIGVAIGGLPSSTTDISVAADTPSGPVGPVPTLGIDPFNTIASTIPSTTTAVITEPVPTTTIVPTTTTTTTTTTSTPPTATTASTATTTASTSTVDGLLDRAEVRLVVANGDGRYNLVGRNVDRLLPLGYVTIDQTDVRDEVERTVLYYRTGFDDEAERLAADLLVPDALQRPLPTTPVTANDQLGDVIVILGPDAIR